MTESMKNVPEVESNPGQILPEELLARSLHRELDVDQEQSDDSLVGRISDLKIIRNLRPTETTIQADLFETIEWDRSYENNFSQERVVFCLQTAIRQGINVIQKELDQVLMNFHGESHNYALDYNEKKQCFEVYADPMLQAFLETKLMTAGENGNFVDLFKHLKFLSLLSYKNSRASMAGQDSERLGFGYEVILGYGFVKLWTFLS